MATSGAAIYGDYDRDSDIALSIKDCQFEKNVALLSGGVMAWSDKPIEYEGL